ncbi:MAG: hypothetical protein JWQ67_1603 [Marmoricola sp.]|jgi:hypothetical protein|nr:hypothetical protein [Marmoricola sp.]MCW2827987.1 hypothetical protein [Marmoricola sp.]
MSALPMSAVLCTWLDAVRAGYAGPDDLTDAVRGDDPRHLVTGLPERGVMELHELPAAVAGRISLALPAPGDPVGLGGPPSFNLAAMDAGEAVVVGDVGLVPEEDARTIVWRAHPAGRVPWVDERETASGLRLALADVTRRLLDLDVAAWQPEIPDLLLNLRHRAPLPLPPGYDARRVETVERAVLCLDILELARADEGGAVSAYEMERRRSALDDLDRAARRALVGACSSRTD